MPAKPADHSNYPAWVGVHVPHDSTDAPPTVRRQFPLDDQQLADELVKMSDHHTQALFVRPESSATPNALVWRWSQPGREMLFASIVGAARAKDEQSPQPN